VKVSPLENFLADHPYKVREYKTRRYSREESVERARARIGEDLYHTVFNNCGHFVAWCITGTTRSTQDLLFGLTGGAWGLLLSRSGPVLHALYRRIRTNFQIPRNRLWVRRHETSVVSSRGSLTSAERGDPSGPAAEGTAARGRKPMPTGWQEQRSVPWSANTRWTRPRMTAIRQHGSDVIRQAKLRSRWRGLS
jgi:hypothetical protein